MRHLPIRTHLIVAAELTAGLTSFVLGIMWVRQPSGPFEPYLVVTGFVFLATEAYRRYEGRLFKVEGVERTPSERVQHHERLRVLFREEVLRCQAQNLRKDVIVRHVNRIDAYPDGSDAPGISAWFKVGLLDTYHAGIEVGLGWEGLVDSPRGFRKADYAKEERGEVTLMLIGEIPYDFIEDMNPDGDEYYYLPHIFCHFANHGEPYERLYYAEQMDMGNGHHYWKEVASYSEVRQNTDAHKLTAA